MTSIGWHRALSDADQQRIRDLIAAASAHDGVAPVGDQVLRELPGDRTRHLLAVDGDDLVGYLNLSPAAAEAPALAELVVHPRAGAAASARRWAGSDCPRAGPAPASGRTATSSRRAAMAAALGLAVVRELLQMRRPLTDLPPVEIPDDVRIATYTGPDDDAELLRVNNAAFAWHPEQSGWTVADIAQRRGEPWFDPRGLFMALDEQSGKLLGFHWTKVHAEEPGLGEVYVVGVDPAAQGRGLGATLTLVGLHHLADDSRA